jgi:hypothetical protein
MQAVQAIARLVTPPAYRGLRVHAKPARLTYSPGVVGIIPIVHVDFRAVPTSYAPWQESGPYLIEATLVVPPRASVALRNISAQVYRTPQEGDMPRERTAAESGVDYDDSEVEQTLAIDGQTELELDTLLDDADTVKVLASHVVDETGQRIAPTIDIPGRLRFARRAYGWVRLRYPRRVAKAWIKLPLLTEYLGYPHNGAAARSDRYIMHGGHRLYPSMIAWPQAYITPRTLLALTAQGLRKAKAPTFRVSGAQVSAIVHIDLDPDIDALLGPDWQARPLIDPITFDLVVSRDGVSETIQSVIMLPEPVVEWGLIWMLTANLREVRLDDDTGRGGMPDAITERSREIRTDTIRLMSDSGEPLPFSIEVKRATRITFGYRREGQDDGRLDMIVSGTG